MKIAFYVFVAYALGGILYYPSQYSLFSFVFILVSSLPLFFAEKLSKYESYSNYRQVNPIIFYGIIILGIYNLQVIANNVGHSFFDIFSLSGIKSIAVESTTRRYEGNTLAHSGNPIILALSLWLVYRAGTQDSKTKNIYTILAFIPILMYTILTTEKWPSFLAGIFFVTGLVISNDNKMLFDILKGKIKYVFLFMLLMLLALFFRGFEGGVLKAIRLLFHYLFAQYNSFGYWYFKVYDYNLSLGKLTFIGPLDYIGVVSRSAGVFAQSLYYYGEPTNIYTAFRYIVQDFSILAPLIFNSIFAFFYVVFNHAKSRLISLVLVFMLFCAFLSTNTTPFVHNSVMLGIVFVIWSDLICERKWTNKGNKT